jgi:hypothetical protein
MSALEGETPFKGMLIFNWSFFSTHVYSPLIGIYIFANNTPLAITAQKQRNRNASFNSKNKFVKRMYDYRTTLKKRIDFLLEGIRPTTGSQFPTFPLDKIQIQRVFRTKKNGEQNFNQSTFSRC